ncbi:MAG: class IV adenylate cyclase [Planctomycetes bacterium]|nr:class IV adenylate cyclase [Planctomycetota bacterium]
MSLSAAPLRVNVELKARLAGAVGRDRALDVARALRAADLGEFEQVDTYFTTGRERMKLRESSSGEHMLIRYSRADQPAARKSQFRMMPLTEPASFKAILTKQWGVKAVVRKRRHLFLWEDRVRIHIDRVDGLGDFLEFEAMLDASRPDYDEAAATLDIAHLRHDFGIGDDDLVATSYSTLALESQDVPSGT